MFTEEQEMYFSTMIILMAFFNLLVFKGYSVFNLHTISNIPVHSIILEKVMKATDLPRKVIHSHVCKKKNVFFSPQKNIQIDFQHSFNYHINPAINDVCISG